MLSLLLYSSLPLPLKRGPHTSSLLEFTQNILNVFVFNLKKKKKKKKKKRSMLYSLQSYIVGERSRICILKDRSVGKLMTLIYVDAG